MKKVPVDITDQYIGRRLREVRSWRGLSLTAVAGLAGITPAYLSYIERGLRPVTKRAMLESLANAVRVSPAELTGQPYAPADPLTGEAHAAIAAVETALDEYELGLDPEVEPRPWPEIAAEVAELNGRLRVEADYAAQGARLPRLLADLHAVYAREPGRRRDALVGMMYAYRSASSVCKSLGVRGLPLLAVRLAQACAEELGDPEWIGYAAYLRGITSGPQGRQHQYKVSVRAVDQIASALADPNAQQLAGTLHLNAALASAAQGDADRTREHLAEADRLADQLPERHDNFAGLWFGKDNVALWRVSLATELGEGGKVAEIAGRGNPAAIPIKSWQATFYADLGRSLASERRTQEAGVQALVTAERTAPQLIRNNPFVRETVSDLLRRAQREAGGRELRGLAWRIGVAPSG